MKYFIGDTPKGTFSVVPSRDDDDLDLSLYSSPAALLIAPTGETTTLAASIDGDDVLVEWPASSPFTSEGIYAVRLTLENGAGHETFTAGRIVVEQLGPWHSIDTIREDWRDAPDSDVKLFTLLVIAREAVEAYAPKLADGAPIPIRYLQAQLLQARNHWNAARADPTNAGLGDDSFVLTPFPLDWTVKQVLRPKTAVPVIG